MKTPPPPDARAAREARLRRIDASIKEGTYRPDPSQIAGCLLEAFGWLNALDALEADLDGPADDHDE